MTAGPCPLLLRWMQLGDAAVKGRGHAVGLWRLSRLWSRQPVLYRSAPGSGQPLYRSAPGRVPPNDLGAEAALLGAILLRADVTADGITAADFYKPAHGHVFEALAKLRANGQPTDLVTVADELARGGLLDVVGGRAFLVELANGCPATSNAETYAGIIAKHARHRRALAEAGAALEALWNDDPAEAADKASAVVALAQGQALHGSRQATSWRPIDLKDALEGVGVPPPELLPRDDGLCLLYRGRVHWFQGEAESLKSWAAQLATALVLKSGQSALYIDYEDEQNSVVERLLALMVPKGMISSGLVYIRPDEPLMDSRGRLTAAAADLADVVKGQAFELAVIDGVTEAMTREDLSLIDNADVVRWLERLPRLLSKSGPAVVCLDHLSRAGADDGRHAIGGIHKTNGTDGVVYSFSPVLPLGRATSRAVTGKTLIKVRKDRPGYIRGRCPDKIVGMLSLTSWPDGGVTGGIERLDASVSTDPNPDLVKQIIDHLLIYDGASKRQLEDVVTGRADAIRNALAWMADPARRLITVERVGQSHRHCLTEG